jgi:ketosteroid isomerase-like protein
LTNANADLARRAYDAINRQDWEALAPLLAPDFALQRATGLGTIEGQQAAVGFASTPDAFQWQTLEPAGEIAERGDRLLVPVLARALGTESDVEIEQRVWHVGTIRDGRFARLEVYFDEAEARAAFGS